LRRSNLALPCPIWSSTATNRLLAHRARAPQWRKTPFLDEI
jgi:hypothetical protein